MVASTITNHIIDPSDTAAWAEKNGQYCEGAGSYHSLVPESGRAYGFAVRGAGSSPKDAVLSALKSGKMVIVLMGPGHFTSGGHFILLRGISDDGKILVSDPASRLRTLRQWDPAIIFKEAKSGASNDGPFWICG